MDAPSANDPKYSFQFKITEKPAIGFAVSEPDAERKVSVVTRGFFYEGGSDFFLVALTHTQQLYLNDFFQKKTLIRPC